jgi:hypothetical protein
VAKSSPKGLPPPATKNKTHNSTDISLRSSAGFFFAPLAHSVLAMPKTTVS